MLKTWVKRSLCYYRLRHLVFTATVMLTSAILCAALLTGESLQQGLLRDLHGRLGAVRTAVYRHEGVFSATLAQRIPKTQAALLLQGEILDTAGILCADQVQVIGLAGHPPLLPINKADAAMLNQRGRAVLPTREGAVRFVQPSLFSAEMPLGTVKEARMVRRAVTFGASTIHGLMPPDFALRAASVPPINIFLPFESLSRDAGVSGMANLLVSSLSYEVLAQKLAAVLTPEDAGLMLETESSAISLLKSRQVFLPRGVPEFLEQSGLTVARSTFHLADSFESGTNTTPYGFVAAVTPDDRWIPRDLNDGEIVVNQWLADRLGLQAGSIMTMRWRRFEIGGRLIPIQRTFRVRQVITMDIATSVRTTMPVFPGLVEVDSCAKWDIGLPLDKQQLQDEANEAYWKTWRETPKAFITYQAGKTGFGTFFGEVMSLRVAADQAVLRQALRSLSPKQTGFSIQRVWEEGKKAAQGSTDFRLLFVGMAFVLMAAALGLVALSLALVLETRKEEVALFSALGWPRHCVVQMLAAEWSVPLLVGSTAGVVLGAVLAHVLMWSLKCFWHEAFAGAEMIYVFSWSMAGVSFVVSAILTTLVLLWVVNRFARTQPVAIWQSVGRTFCDVYSTSIRGVFITCIAGIVLVVAAVIMMVWGRSETAANGAFFGGGLLLMSSLILFFKTLGAVNIISNTERMIYRTPAMAGVRRALMATRRGAPVVVLLAVGVFLTVGILSMKHDPSAGSERTSSGSGGFVSIVTSVVAMDRMRGLELARRVSGSGEGGVVPVRVRDGDEAGCLNMSQPVTPRLLGVEARIMAQLRAFEPENAGGTWTGLETLLEDGAVPALAADQTMLQYSLKGRAGILDGTVLNYTGANGRMWRVRIVGVLPVRSGILQGSLILDEKRFVELFPQEGYRLWLCGVGFNVPRAHVGKASIRYPEPGVRVETVESRLRTLGAIERAYLDMFLVLGGLGVVLGIVGVALVILRGVEERRGELALLNAIGLSRQTIVCLLTAEYGTWVCVGLVSGLIPALVAIQPVASQLVSEVPWLTMSGIVGAMFLCATVSVVIAAYMASCRYGPSVLKEEV